MLARSILAVVCGALAVAAIRELYHPQQQQQQINYYYGPDHQQWVAEWDWDREDDGEYPHRPGPPNLPKPPFPPVPSTPPEPPKLPIPKPPEHPHPPHPPHDPKVYNKTIYQLLEGDDRFQILFKLVKFTEAITHVLNDTESTVTFFAVPDKFLRPHKKTPEKHPHGPPHHPPPHHGGDEEELMEEYFNQVTSQPDELGMFSTLESLVDSVDDKDDKRKKVIKHILTAILSYHIIPAEFSTAQLGSNTTFPTSLIPRDGAFAGQNLRLHIWKQPDIVRLPIPPRPSPVIVNFVSKVVFANVKAENGFVHVVNHPILPPPSVFQILFLLPDLFSTTSSAIQRVGLTSALDWTWNKDSHKLEGSPAVTFFAPTNGAWKRLPKKLKLWLFSPFGEKALKKLLAYHVVPDFIFYSNWLYNASAAEAHFQPQDSSFYEVYDSEFGYQSYENGGAYAFMHDSFSKALTSHTRKHRTPAFKAIKPTSACGALCSNRNSQFGSGPLPTMFPSPLPPPPPPGFYWDEHGHAHGHGHPFPPPPPGWLPPTPPYQHHEGWRSPPAPPHFPECPKMPEDAPPPPPPKEPKPCPPHHPPPPPPPKLPLPHPIYTLTQNLTTLLAPNATLHVHVAQFPHPYPPIPGHPPTYLTKIWVNGEGVVVEGSDVPARNGAVQVVTRLLVPWHVKKGHHHGPHKGPHKGPKEGEPGPGPGPEPEPKPEFEFEHLYGQQQLVARDEKVDEWDGWEEWLPRWADED